MTEVAQLATLIIFAANALLVAGLIALKTTHRIRGRQQAKRKRRYMGLVSRHIAYPNCTDPITPAMATDPAFLDAVIDIRNAVVGPEVETLRGIVDRHGVMAHQIRRLRSSFPLGRRLRAAVALAELGDETAAGVLIHHLSDREPEIRIQAAKGLGRMGWTPAIDVIVGRFATETPWVRARFADTLLGFGSAATWPLLAYITVNHRFEREGPVAAIRTLAALGDDQATQTLIEVLHDATDPEVKIATVETLGALGSPRAVPVLRNQIRSPDWRIRAKTVTALGEIGDVGSLDLLARALTDSDWWVRRNAAAALAKVGGGVDRLYEVLIGKDRFAADAAAESLADAGELAAARRRIGEGRPRERDMTLVGHMSGDRP
ncbi:MAG: HEAT repeat domain-containing protein [Actinobacteria bacterium]|nr:HEAT repeat domain-containing protein [Actinomycetota bacterium]